MTPTARPSRDDTKCRPAGEVATQGTAPPCTHARTHASPPSEARHTEPAAAAPPSLLAPARRPPPVPRPGLGARNRVHAHVRARAGRVGAGAAAEAHAAAGARRGRPSAACKARARPAADPA